MNHQLIVCGSQNVNELPEVEFLNDRNSEAFSATPVFSVYFGGHRSPRLAIVVRESYLHSNPEVLSEYTYRRSQKGSEVRGNIIQYMKPSEFYPGDENAGDEDNRKRPISVPKNIDDFRYASLHFLMHVSFRKENPREKEKSH